MTWHLTDSIEVYAEHVWEQLALRPDLNTLALTQIETVRSGRTSVGDGRVFAWWDDAGRTRGAASVTPPYELLLSLVPNETLEDLVTALREHRTPLPGVNGTPDTATRFAELWTAGTSFRAQFARRLRLYGTENPAAPAPVPMGRARHALKNEVDLLVDWYGAFDQELRNRSNDPRESVRERIESGLTWIWEDDDGTPSSLASRHRPTAGVSRVGPVYTPPEHRRRGFGAAITAACTRDALDTDSTTTVLFADLANPTSNAIYRRIGYHPLEDRVVLSFAS